MNDGQWLLGLWVLLLRGKNRQRLWMVVWQRWRGQLWQLRQGLREASRFNLHWDDARRAYRVAKQSGWAAGVAEFRDDLSLRFHMAMCPAFQLALRKFEARDPMAQRLKKQRKI